VNAIRAEATVDASTDVEAVLNYTLDIGVRPVNYTFDPPPGVPRSRGQVDARKVTIRDAWRVAGLALDVSGFEVIPHRSTLFEWTSFQDSDRIRAVDYPEVEHALAVRTGADKVVIFDHTLRDSTAAAGQPALREPVLRVHDDQTLESAPRRVLKHLPPDEAAWRQTPSEATLLKVYDSATDGRARLTAHTAFDDPTSAPDAPARRSIELRALVFW
jgi:hypothetical protein